MGNLVLTGATSGSTTIAPTDAVTATLTLPSSTGTLLSTTSSIPTSQLSGSITKSQLPTGTVLQVQQATLTSTFSSTSTSFADITGLSVSITPTSSSNKILVRFDVSGSASSMAIYRVTRNGTAIGVGDASGSHSQSATSSLQYAGVNTDRGTYGGSQWLDSPATTSSCTYQVQCVTDGGTWYINRTTADANATGGPRSVSTITVMEISA